MRILVIGAQGNMGRRYCAILKSLGCEVTGYDILTKKEFSPVSLGRYDRAIVATPTKTHFSICKLLIENKTDFLCEKPISKNPEEIKELITLCEEKKVDGRMVCNWTCVVPALRLGVGCSAKYNYYNTGKDGTAWDLIQLIYLSKGTALISTSAPCFSAEVGGYAVTLKDIDTSYLAMIHNWLQHSEFLWDMTDALKATEKVIEYEKTMQKL